ncbi:MAG: hypothetical protein WCS37_12310, partial [Chloroflexota bacterium]
EQVLPKIRISNPKQVLPKTGISNPKQVLPKIRISNPEQVLPKIRISNPKQVLPKIGISNPKQVLPKIGISNPKQVLPKIGIRNPSYKGLFERYWASNRKALQQFGALVLAGGLALLLLWPFLAPYMQAQRDYGFKRDLAETRYWSAAPPSLLRTVQRSWLYKPVQRGILKAQSSGERVMYPGLIALGLAFVGLLGGRKTSRRGLRWTFGVLALVALILSFGPYFNVDEFGDKYQPQQSNFQLPYFWLYQIVPGFDSLRVPHRFAQLLMLALAVCAGYGLAGLQRTKLRAWLLPGLFGLLVAVEFFAPGLPQVPTPMGEQAPALYRWLADPSSRTEVAQDALVLELPLTGPAVPININPEYALYGLLHRRPMLNGTANILPPGFERFYNEVKDFPDLRSLDVAEGLGVKFLLVHRANFSQAGQEALTKLASPEGRLEIVREFGTDVIYRVKPSKRFELPAQLIPQGAEVFIGDDTNHKSLYPAAIIGLLGSGYRYFSSYPTIYTPQIQPALPNRVYDYALLYRGTDPTTYGYLPSDQIWQNEVIQLYHKQ